MVIRAMYSLVIEFDQPANDIAEQFGFDCDNKCTAQAAGVGVFASRFLHHSGDT